MVGELIPMMRKKKPAHVRFDGFFVRDVDGELRQATDEEIGRALANAYKVILKARRRRLGQTTEPKEPDDTTV